MRWSMSFWREFHRCRRGEDSCAPTVAAVEKLVACSPWVEVEIF